MRARILRAALNLFSRRGFFATTVEQITEAADVGKGTFFNYFPTKEHVLAGFGQVQIEKVRAALISVKRRQGPIREVLRDLVVALSREPARSQALVRSLLVANLSSEPVRLLMRRNLARGRRLLAQVMAYGQERGELRRDQKATEMARIFQQAFFGTLVLWAMYPPSRFRRWLDGAFRVLWYGVRRTCSRMAR
jgi:AcrR family transcriptional regulator